MSYSGEGEGEGEESYEDSVPEESQQLNIQELTKQVEAVYKAEKLFLKLQSELYYRGSSKKQKEINKILLDITIKENYEKSVNDSGLQGILNLKICGVESNSISISLDGFDIEGSCKKGFDVSFGADTSGDITVTLTSEEFISRFDGFEIEEVNLTYESPTQEMVDFVKMEYDGNYQFLKNSIKTKTKPKYPKKSLKEDNTLPHSIELYFHTEDMEKFLMGG
jgi:hypothetical protein